MLFSVFWMLKLSTFIFWDEIKVFYFNIQNTEESIYRSGHNYTNEIILDIKNIPPENVGVEFVVTQLDKYGGHKFVARKEFELVSRKKSRVIYHLDFLPEKAGAFFYGVRIYARHKELPHRQDFSLLRWVD